jgi:hypothetical protein
MPLLFTATLEHGTLPHASGALIPFGAAFVVAGIEATGAALARLRGKDAARLARDMSIIAVAFAALVSLGMAWRTMASPGDEYTRDATVVAWLQHHNPRGTPTMVLDPPAFVKRRKDLAAGKDAYRRLNQLAMQLLERDGMLISCSCSHHMSGEDLLGAIQTAARHLGRDAQVLEQGMQAPDHPVHPAIPETSYLKAFYIRVVA